MIPGPLKQMKTFLSKEAKRGKGSSPRETRKKGKKSEDRTGSGVSLLLSHHGLPASRSPINPSWKMTERMILTEAHWYFLDQSPERCDKQVCALCVCPLITTSILNPEAQGELPSRVPIPFLGSFLGSITLSLRF